MFSLYVDKQETQFSSMRTFFCHARLSQWVVVAICKRLNLDCIVWFGMDIVMEKKEAAQIFVCPKHP